MFLQDVKKIEVTLEDQQNINSFNKLNTKMHEIEAMIKAKKVSMGQSCSHTSLWPVGACIRVLHG